MDYRCAYLIVNFGGPRSLGEIEEFLIALLTDQDVIRTSFPPFIHQWLFRRVAKKRAVTVVHDYALIGGKSPIYEDTETIAKTVQKSLNQPIFTFHRYLPETHPAFIKTIEQLECEEIRVFPMFPQFSYATTGSIARWFLQHLSSKAIRKIRWIKSYPDHPAYITAFQNCIREFLENNQLQEEKTTLLFSAHGLPQRFIDTGDLYESECHRSFSKIAAAFPKTASYLSYQSQFGKEEWLRPYTNEFCQQVEKWSQGRQHVVFIPLSFTSDHIETLYEIEQLYLPVIRERGFYGWRCPALNFREDWITAIGTIAQSCDRLANGMLVWNSN
jgi:ferrochelatase